jgi:hypothetical protein
LTSENNWVLCQGDLQDGPHFLTVKANVSNQQTFWFDQIQYAPLASANVSLLNQPLLRIDPTDSAIQYQFENNTSSGWQSINISSGSIYPPVPGQPISLNGNTSLTQTTGARLTYQFTGS